MTPVEALKARDTPAVFELGMQSQDVNLVAPEEKDDDGLGDEDAEGETDVDWEEDTVCIPSTCMLRRSKH